MTAPTPAGNAADRPGGGVKSLRELLAGLLLLALAAAGWVGTLELNPGHLSAMGPGMMPKITSVAVAIFGLLLIAQSFILEDPAALAWNVRGIVFVFGGVLLFAATIRSFGLGVAGPLAVVASSLADRDTRLIEIVPFALVMTALSALLFQWALGLPIPILPFFLDY
jgi:hypothetical protein